MSRSTVSNSIPRQKPKLPQKSYLIGYLTAITTIVGVHITFCYVSSARSLEQQVDERLLTLVQAAAPSLEIIQASGHNEIERNLSWRYLFSSQKQSLEWFDANGRLLAREGASFPQFPLVRNVSFSQLNKSSPLYEQKNSLRSVTIAVYVDNLQQDTFNQKKPFLEGYIRASLSERELVTVLAQKRLEFCLSGILLLILLGISSVYLTEYNRPPTNPISQHLEQLTNNLSHYFRHFLTKISLPVELMLSRREQYQPSDIKKLERIDVATKQMQRLVEDLLFLIRADMKEQTIKIKKDSAKGEGAKPTLRDRIFLNVLLQEAIARCEAIAQAKRILLQADLFINVEVRGDATQLNQIFSHLLNNAIAYTDAGGSIVISVKSSRKWAIVSVEDTGIGISPEDLTFIFQWFWRSQPAKTLYPDGLGLGLAIAEAIVSQHGGKITVDSQLERGSCFQVSLPLG
jgi:two-component system, OmpR family, manganese sensing sensor histidine kinase